MSKSPNRPETVLLAVLAVTGLAACAGNVRTGDGDSLALRSEAFAAYAERIFRFQNEVLDELAFAIDASPDDARLLNLEDQVLSACDGLNAIAVRRRDGGGTRPLRDAAAARRVPECELAATQAADSLEQWRAGAG